MISEELKHKWEIIENLPRQGDYDLIRISPECQCDMSLAITPDAHRCLVLALPYSFSFEFHPIEREKLSLTKIKKKNYVAVTLLNNDSRDIFDDLIVSMHNAIKGITLLDEYASIFIQTFHKWVKLFDKSIDERLPDSVIIGMFGELITMKKLLIESPKTEVDVILGAWRGPFDQGHDYVFDDRNIEVKTRGPKNTSVHIANEYQLEQLEAKGLVLSVVVAERDTNNGITLRELTRDIVNIVEGSLGDTAILYTAMRQKNLGPHNLPDYDDIVLHSLEITLYDCLSDNFPRLIRSELPMALFKVEYSLNTAHLSNFTIEQVTL
jgi:hypothetical protein